ncbi:UPF0481 protein At3g47200-like [Triticum urartu]|uniref:UPF0481 protein At3g47200-like n=1 Tax=Triticum urartu TaxID=4572 RepID=UPI0020444DD9|nr:UPF0481 protein At3g47200-like [Triticum urartu]
MEAPYDYQLAVADYYWEGRPAVDPNVWVPGVPLEMTVAPTASQSGLVDGSPGRPQLKLIEEESIDHHYAVEVFKQAAQSLQEERDKMETKIHMFPPSMGDLAAKYAFPKVVAIGPYHHGRTPALRQMESTKHVAAWHFINDSGRLVEEVYGAVCAVADEARSHYDEDKVRAFGDDDFNPMMFYDGCFLLQFLLHWVDEAVDPLLKDAFSSNCTSISYDIALLENQLPWVVVQELMRFMPTPPDLVRFTTDWKATMQPTVPLVDNSPLAWDDSYTPLHLLELLRYYIVGSTTETPAEPDLHKNAEKISISVSAMELAEIGIEITATKPTADLKEMGVNDKPLLTGELLLAPLSLDDANASFLVNMAVLELCTTPDFSVEVEEKSAVCSYLCLLGMVTDSEEDVQQLRKKGILLGGAGLSNKDALELLNRVENRLRPGTHYMRTMVLIENYRKKRPRRIKFHKFHYNYRKAIILTLSGIAGLASFLGALKSLNSSKS